MGDSEDFKMLSKQSKELDVEHDNYPELEQLSTNCSIPGVENDGQEPKTNENDDDADIVLSDAEDLPLNETNVDNHLAENDIHEPKNNVEHTIIEVVTATDENVPLNLINVDNDDSKQGMTLVLEGT